VYPEKSSAGGLGIHGTFAELRWVTNPLRGAREDPSPKAISRPKRAQVKKPSQFSEEVKYMELNLNNRVAAVAAASQGLGYAAALELAREGAAVAICSRDVQRITEAAERINNTTGSKIIGIAADLSKADQARSFVEEAAKTLGSLDILVTNAGGPPPGALDDIDDAGIEQAFHLTLESALTLMRTAIPYMRQKKWGRIVNILSMTVKQPKTTLLLSNTMRPAILGFAKSISLELAKENILINNVAPGYTRTERLEELAADLAKRGDKTAQDVFQEWEESIPMNRLGKPEELGRVIAFLASDAASYVTGVTVQVDGGSVLGLL
jgi:3-oxoacyl-[acyl-carrier protein] reductase